VKFKSKVTSDQKDILAMIKRLHKLEEYQAEYGYFDEDAHSSGLSMSHIAYIHENGEDSNDIPARPFMSQAGDYHAAKFESKVGWKQDVFNYLKAGGRIDKFYLSFTREGIDSIQTAILRQDFEPNAPHYLAYKVRTFGHDLILIASSEMYEGAKGKAVKR
jgi:hypothetical protein